MHGDATPAGATPCAGAAAALESLRRGASHGGGSDALCRAGGSDADGEESNGELLCAFGAGGGGVGNASAPAGRLSPTSAGTPPPAVGEAMLRCLDKTHDEGCRMCVARDAARLAAGPCAHA
jgi:hypothetical protein